MDTLSQLVPHTWTLLRLAVLGAAVRLAFVPMTPRRFVGGALVLMCISMASLAARVLPADAPFRIWMTSMADDFPLSWGSLGGFARIRTGKTAPAD